MKKITIKIVFLLLPLLTVTAQTKQLKKTEIKKNIIEESKKNLNDSIKDQTKNKKYNLWSVNVMGGGNIAVRPFTAGYYSTTQNYFNNPDFNHFEFNVRKMFNTKFGLRWNFVNDKFKNQQGSLPFKNNMYRTSVEAVLNVHRIMNWEEFNDTFGLQLHMGPGFSFLHAENTTTFNHYDNIFSFVGGATALVKISNHFMASIDYTIQENISEHVNLDGKGLTDYQYNRTGTMFSTSVGLTYYFGKKQKHADWYYDNEDKLAALKNKVAALEAKMVDADKDGVPDYLDIENNTPAGVVVDTKGRAVDLNINGVPDEIEKYINNKTENPASTTNNSVVMGDTNLYSNAQMKSMINGGFVNVFFDFDQIKITTGTISSINWLIKYLVANPKSNLKIIGYADELGDFNYNIGLSHRRANVVREMIVRWGISPKRITLSFKGEDNSVPKESKLARQLVRRVTFEVD